MLSSGTSVLAQPKRGSRRGRKLKKGRLSWKEAGWETGERWLQGDRTGQGGNGVNGRIHTKDYTLSSQRVASAGTEDFRILRLGDNEPLPAPSQPLGKKSAA